MIENILIRRSSSKNSDLFYIDVDGNTVYAENIKELLKIYISELIDKL